MTTSGWGNGNCWYVSYTSGKAMFKCTDMGKVDAGKTHRLAF